MSLSHIRFSLSLFPLKQAGDVASFYDKTFGLRRRIEHYDHSMASGKIAAVNMLGARKPYIFNPMFWYVIF